jgi:hypothetical protein
MLFLKSLVRSLSRYPRTPRKPIRRSAVLRLEVLEGRALPSVNPVIASLYSDPAQVANHREIEHRIERKSEHEKGSTSADTKETFQERHQEDRLRLHGPGSLLRPGPDQSPSPDQGQTPSPDQGQTPSPDPTSQG